MEKLHSSAKTSLGIEPAKEAVILLCGLSFRPEAEVLPEVEGRMPSQRQDYRLRSLTDDGLAVPKISNNMV